MRFRLRTLLIVLAVGPPMLSVGINKFREAYRRSQLATYPGLSEPTRFLWIPLPQKTVPWPGGSKVRRFSQ
jgi:hypothetical protein